MSIILRLIPIKFETLKPPFVQPSTTGAHNVGNMFPNSQQPYTRWRCNIKGLSQHRGRTDFSRNLRASLFN
jgi:hypothetical protein